MMVSLKYNSSCNHESKVIRRTKKFSKKISHRLSKTLEFQHEPAKNPKDDHYKNRAPRFICSQKSFDDITSVLPGLESASNVIFYDMDSIKELKYYYLTFKEIIHAKIMVFKGRSKNDIVGLDKGTPIDDHFVKLMKTKKIFAPEHTDVFVFPSIAMAVYFGRLHQVLCRKINFIIVSTCREVVEYANQLRHSCRKIFFINPAYEQVAKQTKLFLLELTNNHTNFTYEKYLKSYCEKVLLSLINFQVDDGGDQVDSTATATTMLVFTFLFDYLYKKNFIDSWKNEYFNLYIRKDSSKKYSRIKRSASVIEPNKKNNATIYKSYRFLYKPKQKKIKNYEDADDDDDAKQSRVVPQPHAYLDYKIEDTCSIETNLPAFRKTIRRICCIIFVDFQSFPKFFTMCKEIPPTTMIYLFFSSIMTETAKLQLKSAYETYENIKFSKLDKRLKKSITCLKVSNAPGIALSIAVGRFHQILCNAIQFIIVSKEEQMDEILRLFRHSKRPFYQLKYLMPATYPPSNGIDEIGLTELVLKRILFERIKPKEAKRYLYILSNYNLRKTGKSIFDHREINNMENV